MCVPITAIPIDPWASQGRREGGKMKVGGDSLELGHQGDLARTGERHATTNVREELLWR